MSSFNIAGRFALLFIVVGLVSGCAILGTREEATSNSSVQVDNVKATEESPKPAPTEETDEEQSLEAADIQVITGKTTEQGIMLEGMLEYREFKEYTIMPYDIHYKLSAGMGEPLLENGQVMYKSGSSMISLELYPGVSLKEAIAAAEGKYIDEFEIAPMDISVELNNYPGKENSFYKDSIIYGYKVFDIDGNALVIHYQYYGEAGDGMHPVIMKMVESVRQAK